MFVTSTYLHNLVWDTLWWMKVVSFVEYKFFHECRYYEMLETWFELFGHLIILIIYMSMFRLQPWCSWLVWMVAGAFSPAYYSREPHSLAYRDGAVDPFLDYRFRLCRELLIKLCIENSKSPHGVLVGQHQGNEGLDCSRASYGHG